MQTKFINHISGSSEGIVVSLTVDQNTISLTGASTEFILKKINSSCEASPDFSKLGTIDSIAKTLTFFIQKDETSSLIPGEYEYRIFIENGANKRCACFGVWKIRC